MINKLIAKKRINPPGVKANQKAQIDSQKSPNNHEARTVLENNPDFHGKAPNAAEMKIALEELA